MGAGTPPVNTAGMERRHEKCIYMLHLPALCVTLPELISLLHSPARDLLFACRRLMWTVPPTLRVPGTHSNSTALLCSSLHRPSLLFKPPHIDPISNPQILHSRSAHRPPCNTFLHACSLIPTVFLTDGLWDIQAVAFTHEDQSHEVLSTGHAGEILLSSS